MPPPPPPPPPPAVVESEVPPPEYEAGWGGRLFFAPFSPEITAAGRAMLDRYAREGVRSGADVLVIAGAKDAREALSAPDLGQQRAEAVSRYMRMRGFDLPIEVVERLGAGAGPSSAEPSPRDRYVAMQLRYLATAAPEEPAAVGGGGEPPAAGERPGAARPPRDRRPDGAAAEGAYSQLIEATAGGDAGTIQLSGIRVWTTSEGTLTGRALAAILAQCRAVDIELPDCGADIAAGTPPFDLLPESARDEAVLLLRACRGMRAGGDCAALARRKRELRDLPLGRLDPEPDVMREGETATFTAFVRRSSARRLPGREAPVLSEGEDGSAPPAGQSDSAAPGDGGTAPLPLVEYSQDMCFELEAEAEDFRIAGKALQCPPYLESGEFAYAPEWQVTPLRGGRLALRLTRVLRLGDNEERVPQEPYPVFIDVEPKPSLAQRVIAWLTEWTGVAEAARGFVLAVEALILAIAGLSIWKLFRRRRRDAGDPTAPTPALPSAPPGN